MDAGEMTERVVFVDRSRTKRPDGGYDVSDSVLGEVWAAVRPVVSREGEQAGRLFGSTTYLITIYADDKPAVLTSGHHAVWLTGGNVQFNIRAVRQDRPQSLFLEIVGEAGAVI